MTTQYGPVRGILMSPDVCLVNEHTFFNSKGVLRATPIVFTYASLVITVSYEEVVHYPDCEFVGIPNKFKPYCANLWRKCLKVPSPDQYDTVILYPTNTHVVTRAGTFSMNDKTYKSRVWTGSVQPGDCGTILIGQVGEQCFIAGAISYRTDFMTKASISGGSILVDSIEAITAPMGAPTIEAIEFSGLPRSDFSPLTEYSEFMSNPIPTLIPLGKSTEPTKSFKSALRKTRFFEVVEPFFSKEYAIPRRVGGMVGEGECREWHSAWKHTYVHSHLSDSSQIGLKLVAMEAYLEDVMKFKESQPANFELHPLSLYEPFMAILSWASLVFR